MKKFINTIEKYITIIEKFIKIIKANVLSDHMTIAVGILGKIISKYTGYAEGKRKEDDLAVKKAIKNEIDKSRNHLKNVLEIVYEKNEEAGIKTAKKVLDELDIFANEIDLSEAGHRYGFFSTHRGASLHSLKKLIKFDRELIEKMSNVTEASNRIEKVMLGEEELNLSMELGKIRNYVTDARNKYKDRIEYLKRL